MPKKKTKEKATKRPPRTGQKKLQCDPQGCELIVEAVMEEYNLSQAEALRLVIRQWSWLIAEQDRPILNITCPNPGSIESEKKREALVESLHTANQELNRIETTLRRFSTQLHDPQDAIVSLEKLETLSDTYSLLYNDARGGIVAYLNLVPPDVIAAALESEKSKKAGPLENFVLGLLFNTGDES